jgi:hypothetical protein
MRKPHTTLTDAFHNFAKQLSAEVGSPWAFIAALGIVVVWSVTGPLFKYSDTWQLVINTGHNDCDLSHGVPDSEHTEPRRQGRSSQAR